MSDVLFEKKGHTGLITINKPATLNALCKSLIEDINAAFDKAESDPEIYTVIITGTGKSFAAGADIEEMVDMTPDEIFEWSANGSGLNLRIENMELPVIAAVNGYALGGGLELAMACDIRIASDNAKLGLPEVKLGVICGAGGTQRLPAIVGESISKELIFTGRSVDAQEALRIGLVNKVTSYEGLLHEAFAMAHAIEKNGQLAVRASKKCIHFARTADTEEGSLYERQVFSPLFSTEDQKIGMGAFLRKEKKPEFKNK